MAGENVSLQVALEIFHDHLPDIKQALLDNITYLVGEIPKPIVDDDELKNEIRGWVYQAEVEAIVLPRKKVFDRIVSRMQNYGKVKQISDQLTPDQIERAREYPITDLFDGRLYREGNRYMTGRCPFHNAGNERTPSFKINVKTNKWRCFGCSLYGDAIEYLMTLEGIKFKPAVRKLLNL